MNEYALAYMETFYLALGDRTRLRLLNLMNGNELCVDVLTKVLGESQPKISRHLACLRNSGIVETRREGKWIYYTIACPSTVGARSAMEGAFGWFADDDQMVKDRRRYAATSVTNLPVKGVPETLAAPGEPRIVHAEEVSEEYSAPAHNEIEDFLL